MPARAARLEESKLPDRTDSEPNLSDPSQAHSADGRVTTTVVVPGDQSMVALLGPGDELLRVIERNIASDLHVRGNEITITGAAADNALATRLIEELLAMTGAGQQLTPDAVTRVYGMLTAATGERPAEVLNLSILS